MPIRFAIHSRLDMVVYIFEQKSSAEDYVAAYHAVYNDPRRHHGMKILMDMSTSILELEPRDFWKGVAIMRKNFEEGHNPDHVAVVTPNDSMKYFTETLKVMADNIPVHLSVFHNPVDAIRWLGVPSDQEDEALQFYQTIKD